MDFGKVITAMVTPFQEDLSIDWKQVDVLIDYLIEEQQSDALVISGTTGESPTLSDAEKLQLFEAAVKRANGRAKIIAGTGSNDTRHSIHLTREAEKLGVDGVLLVAPYYNRPSQEGLYQHFKAIAESTSLPIMVYNVPHRTGIQLAAETTIRLSRIENIVASKEATPDLNHISEVIAKSAEGFRVYGGDDSLTLPVLAIGGYGIVSVASHVIGREMKQLVEAFYAGQNTAAAQLHAKLFPVFTGIFKVPSPAPIKHALNIRGVHVGGVRLPLLPVSEEEGLFVASLF
ncbi:4-hydroxy-tetrahydrodipicolinate synthase [Paenibacillus koleovorans]|uniref:4-hydroxy-tetrahydrodipicolinate synthase n=1 Tax=Paenibacillus koleovorans TaxID=121608 RepID=UPI000FD81462|nr:4-hydroxy-tetrahydrodipicolinate synthase [Paenibacillus koleovorans]